MTKHYLFRILATSLMLLLVHHAFTQTLYTNLVITANSGKFEFVPPYTDVVTIGHYNPATQNTQLIGSIGTQSAQDILISGPFAYVTAQDSLIKYRIATGERIAAIADSGLNKLLLHGNRLIVSKQYPTVLNFLEVLDTTDLSLITHVTGIPGDCGGLAMTGDSIYVAVNGGWMGTEGQLAVIDPNSWSLTNIHNLGVSAVGIFNLYNYKDKIYSVNKTPYLAPNEGTVTEFDPNTGAFVNHPLPVIVGNGAGIKDSILYLRMNNGLGSYNLHTAQIMDTTVISDPGTVQYQVILSVGVDTVSDRLYVNIGDYVVPGFCLVTTLSGDSITSYPTGISSECVAIDYRHYPAGFENLTQSQTISVFPNPAKEMIHITSAVPFENATLTLYNSNGQVVLTRQGVNSSDEITIPVFQYATGIYLVSLQAGENRYMVRFIKNQ